MDFGDLFDEKIISDVFPDVDKDKNKDRALGGIDMDELDDVLSQMTIDMSKTMYIICDHKSFRSESLNTMLSVDFKTDVVYTNSNPKPPFRNALCFVVDVSTDISQKCLHYIKSFAKKNNIPVFLLGETEEINDVSSIFDLTDAEITAIERPIEMKECVELIESVLTTLNFHDNKRHIMIVDDSITFLRLVQKTLEKKYHITIASSAYDCIVKIGALNDGDTIDLFILDFRMPTVDGRVLCQMLREQERFKDTPIIFYSGNDSGDVNEIIQLMSAGIDGYVLKSQPVTSLEAYLESVFAKKEKERSKHK